MNDAQTFLMVNMKAFPAERLPFIQQELEGLQEQEVAALLMTDIKNPTTALLLALFLGEVGADRFYIGNKELGIAKLVLTVLGIVTLIAVVGFFLLLGVVIWKIVDCCLIMGACRETNFERLMMQIGQIKSVRQVVPISESEITMKEQ